VLCKYRRIEFRRIIDLEPAQLYSTGYISGGVRLREHVLYLLTAFDIPLRYIVFFKCLVYILVEQLLGITLTGYLHYLECELRLKTLMHKINHNIITATDNLGNRAYSVRNKLLCVSEPYVSTVRQTRDL